MNPVTCGCIPFFFCWLALQEVKFLLRCMLVKQQLLFSAHDPKRNEALTEVHPANTVSVFLD